MTTISKKQAAAIFGGRFADLAQALAVSPQAISQWPNHLNQKQTDQVIGAAIRLDATLPHQPTNKNPKNSVPRT